MHGLARNHPKHTDSGLSMLEPQNIDGLTPNCSQGFKEDSTAYYLISLLKSGSCY